MNSMNAAFTEVFIRSISPTAWHAILHRYEIVAEPLLALTDPIIDLDLDP